MSDMNKNTDKVMEVTLDKVENALERLGFRHGAQVGRFGSEMKRRGDCRWNDNYDMEYGLRVIIYDRGNGFLKFDVIVRNLDGSEITRSKRVRTEREFNEIMLFYCQMAAKYRKEDAEGIAKYLRHVDALWFERRDVGGMEVRI